MMPQMPMMPMMPVLPVMPFAQNKNPWSCFANMNSCDNTCGDDFMSGMKKFWEQMIDVQKTSLNGTRDQWNQFFEHMMDMQDTFAESLPDELPSLPGFPQMPAISPKDFMKRAKEFQEMTNAHFVEQADSVKDFYLKGQEKACDMACAAMDNAKAKKEAEKEEPAQDEGGEAPAEQ